MVPITLSTVIDFQEPIILNPRRSKKAPAISEIRREDENFPL